MIKQEKWGEHNGKDIFLFTLDNGNGLSAEIINIGCVIKSLKFKGTDVVLGYDNLSQYLDNYASFGAVVGRTAGRIPYATFDLNDVTYKLNANQGDHNLHGGACLRSALWSAEAVDGDEPSVVLTYLSPDGEEGFPGNLSVTVTYTLTKDNTLKYLCTATTDKDTPFNPTNHSYFNLSGHASDRIYDQVATVYSDFYLPASKQRLATGEVLSVKDTPYDLRQPTNLGDLLKSDNEEINLFGGIDHCYFTRERGYTKIASLYSDKTDISMDVFTDLPAFVVYTTTGINEEQVCKDGKKYLRHQAICFEPGFPPPAVCISHLPSLILKSGEKYKHITEYKFK